MKHVQMLSVLFGEPKEDKVLKLPLSPIDGLAHLGIGLAARQV